MIGGALSRRGLWLDPRTKILLLLLCILSAMMAPSLFYELGLVVLIGLLGICFGKWKYAWKGVLFYALIVLLTFWIMDTMTGTWRTMFIAFLGLFHKVYPCGMLSGIVISTTKVSEFLSAMNRIHAPQKLVIPLAVMLRYIPTIQEDWRFIKDAMRMRDVSAVSAALSNCAPSRSESSASRAHSAAYTRSEPWKPSTYWLSFVSGR